MNIDMLEQYKRGIAEIALAIDSKAVSEALEALAQACRNGNRIFAIGNGGSAATAMHFATDLSKNATLGAQRFKALSLCDSSSALTAYGNDVGYHYVFTGQLRNLLEPGDVVVAISASGNSPNIIDAAEYAKRHGAALVALTGFSGGKLRELADISVHIPCDSYEMAEDAHSIICHMMVYSFKIG